MILHQADTLIGKYLPMLKQVGIVDENNKESYHTEGDIRAYKDALKALYYLISIEKSK